MPLTERDYDLLSLYIDDALTPPERRALESRLASDAEFRAELDTLRQTIALVKSLPEMVAPRDLRLTPAAAAEILAELKAAVSVRKPRPSIVYRLATVAAAAASLVLVFTGALTLLQPDTRDGSGPTVAVADVMLTGETSNETPTLKTGEDGTTMGLMAPEGTLIPDATGGFGGGTDPDDTADTALLQEEAETGAPDIFSAVPAPVITGSEEPPAIMMEEMEAPGDAAFIPGTPPPPTTPTRATAGSAGRLEMTATEDAGPTSRTFAVAPPGTLALTPALTEAALAEMSMPPSTRESPAQVIETVMADAAEDRAAVDEAREQTEAEPITEPSSPLLGFALVIAGLALGVVALVMVVRTG